LASSPDDSRAEAGAGFGVRGAAAFCAVFRAVFRAVFLIPAPGPLDVC
jgi:hypothetical protein